MGDSATASLLNLLQYSFPSVDTIVWDLDGTLGPMPGWNGRDDLFEYIVRPLELHSLLDLLQRCGIDNVLVSRNGMFCKTHYADSQQEFEMFGFDAVLPCYRRRSHSKVREFEQPRHVLLIDDNKQECIEACRDGAFAIHIKDVALDALPRLNYDIYIPFESR